MGNNRRGQTKEVRSRWLSHAYKNARSVGNNRSQTKEARSRWLSHAYKNARSVGNNRRGQTKETRCKKCGVGEWDKTRQIAIVLHLSETYVDTMAVGLHADLINMSPRSDHTHSTRCLTHNGQTIVTDNIRLNNRSSNGSGTCATQSIDQYWITMTRTWTRIRRREEKWSKGNNIKTGERHKQADGQWWWNIHPVSYTHLTLPTSCCV